MYDEYEDEYEGQTEFRKWFERTVRDPMTASKVCVIETRDPHFFLNDTDSHVRELWYTVNYTKDGVKEYVKRLSNQELSAIINKLVYDLEPMGDDDDTMVLRKNANFAVKYATIFAALEKYEIVAALLHPEVYTDQVLEIIKELMRLFTDHYKDPDNCEYTLFPKTLTEPSK